MTSRAFFALACVLVACNSDSFVSDDGGGDASPPVDGGAKADALPEAAPPLTCDGGETACGSVCVDTSSDAKNCGACGHDCLGGDCKLGVCQPFTIATGQMSVTSIAPSPTQLCWANKFGIFVADLDGKNQGTLYDSGGNYCQGLSVDGSDSYFICASTIFHCALPSCSGGPTALVSAQNLYATALDETNQRIYFAVKSPYDSQTGGYVASIATSGGAAARLVAPDQLDPLALIIESGWVYWVDNGTYLNDVGQKNGGIRRAPLGTNQTAMDLVSWVQVDSLGGVAVSGNTLYFTEGGTMQSASTTGGLQTTFESSVGAANVIADAQYVYWTDFGSPGHVYRCEQASCKTPLLLASGEGGPGSITQDAVSIYWANYFGGQIRRLAK